MKTKKIIKIVSLLLFFSILITPLTFQITGKLIGKKLDLQLKGNIDTYEKPDFNVKTYFNGEFQNQFSDWLDNNLSTRGIYIKSYNQLRYSLFNLGNEVIGNNKDIFEEGYITSELGLDSIRNYVKSENQQNLEEYVNDLLEISDKLEAVGKHLIFYITPSKAKINRQDIPKKYFYLQGTEKVITGYEYLNKLLKDTNLSYIDAYDYEEDVKDSATFYNTGIHWARPYEEKTETALLNMIESIGGYKIRKFELGELISSDQPYQRDSDVFDLLNVFSSYPVEKYYEYTKKIQTPDNTKPLKVLMQGGSFSEGMITDYFSEMKDSSLYYINYKNYILDYRDSWQAETFSEWSDLNFQEYLDNSDFVIIEMNDEAVYRYSEGFADYLNEFLSSYIPGNLSKVLDDRFKPSEGKGMKESRGYYDIEDDYSWVKKDSCLNLYNSEFSKKGISITIDIPSEVIESDTVIDIYVNGVHVAQLSNLSPGRSVATIPASKVSSDNGKVVIEMICNNSFVLNTSNEKNEQKEVAFKVLDVEEKN